MRVCLLLAVLLSLAAANVLAASPPPVKAGDVVFAADFERPDALRSFSKPAGTVQVEALSKTAHALAVEGPAGGGTTCVTAPLPVERLRGCKLDLSARMKAENVSAKPQPWNGIKFMMVLESADDKSNPQADIPVGTFDWQQVFWQVYVPPNATKMTLFLGLEGVAGKVWFDDVEIRVRRPRPATDPKQGRQGPPPLRGVMYTGDGTNEGNFKQLGRDWNANLIRWMLMDCLRKPEEV
jgi:hypothetical protein